MNYSVKSLSSTGQFTTFQKVSICSFEFKIIGDNVVKIYILIYVILYIIRKLKSLMTLSINNTNKQEVDSYA